MCRAVQWQLSVNSSQRCVSVSETDLLALAAAAAAAGEYDDDDDDDDVVIDNIPLGRIRRG